MQQAPGCPILGSAPFAGSALEAIEAQAFALRQPWSHERRSVLRSETAILLDRLLTRVARSRGARDVAVGERLAALAVGDRVLRLGFSGIGDYGRERLGMSGRTAQELARLARELRDRPVLAEAVRQGEVSARKAEVVLAVARGEAEAAWVERARVESAGPEGGRRGGGETAHPERRVAQRPVVEGRAAGPIAANRSCFDYGRLRRPTLSTNGSHRTCSEFLGACGAGDRGRRRAPPLPTRTVQQRAVLARR